MIPAIVVPLGRDNAQYVLRNYQRQRVKIPIVVVENGAGVGSCARAGFRPTLTLTSDQHQSAAKNVGLAEMRERGATHWLSWDDDDWYGPEYVAEALAAFGAGHEVIGKAAHFVKLANNCTYFIAYAEQDIQSDRYVDTVKGAARGAVFWDDQPSFREDMASGEDTQWALDVGAQGKRIWAVSPFHFCYMRHGRSYGHASPLTDAKMLETANLMGDVFDVGVWGNGGGGAARVVCSGDVALATRHRLPRPTVLDERDTP